MSEQEESVEEVELPEREKQDIVSNIFLYSFTFLLFLLPVKFGSSFLPTTIPSFPDSVIFASWPGYFLTIFSGVFLILSIIIYRPGNISKSNFLIILSWLVIMIFSAAFGYNKYNTSYYLYSINQALIAVISGLTAAICLRSEPRSRRFIIAGICGGLIYTAANGLYQYLWGFQESINYYQEMASRGVFFADAHVSRIKQKLVFSHFTISNSFAAHIILTLPLTVYLILKKLNKEHVIACRVFGTTLLIFSFSTFMASENQTLTIITLVLGMLLCFGLDHLSDNALKSIGHLLILLCLTVLALTRSRAGIICFIAGLAFAGAVCGKGNVRKGCIAALVVGLGLGAYYAPKIGSFQVRLGYYEALIKMFKEDPMGHGFGSFSEFYNRTKGPGIEESNSPHSFFFGYLGQAGLFGGLSVIACFAVGIATVVRQKKMDPLLKFCIIAGFSSWYFHSQLDFNIMIPGTVTIASIILMLSQKEDEGQRSKKYSPIFTALIPITITAIYFAVQHSYHQKKYTDFHSSLNDVNTQPPPIDKVKNELSKLAELFPYSTEHYDETASWAMKKFDSLKGKDQIQEEAYLLLADAALRKAVEINPKRSGFYTRLARISFERRNFNQTRAMLDKAFELYPFNSSALALERHILAEMKQREPNNLLYIELHLKNNLKGIEISLGQMRFRDHLLLSQNQVESMYLDLDKRVTELYTEIGLIRKAGVKVSTDSILRHLKDIHTEARKIAGVDR